MHGRGCARLLPTAYSGEADRHQGVGLGPRALLRAHRWLNRDATRYIPVMPEIISVSLPVTAEQAEKLRAAKPGTTVHHPRAGTRAGRAQVSRAVMAAGVPARLAKTFAWSTTGAAPATTKPAKPAGKRSAEKPATLDG